MQYYSLCRNGPVGSAVCVFTFNEQDKNNVATVFNADYLRQNSDQQWVPLPNYEPFTVSYLLSVHVYTVNLACIRCSNIVLISSFLV